MIRKYIILVAVSLLSALGLMAQHNTSSPYTRFGYGTILDGGFGQSRAMGGISYGLRPEQFTNPMQPASYTSSDSLNFRMEAGVSFQFSNFKAENGSTTEHDGNLEFLAFQFPIKKWVALSFGVMPYSIVGYDFQESQKVASSILAGSLSNTYKYTGEGGITQLYAGIAFRPVNWLSFGGNLLFSFGTIAHESQSIFLQNTYFSTSMKREIKVKDVTGNFGVQATIPMKENHSLTIGGVMQLKSELNTDATQTIITTDTTTLNYDNKFDLPMYFGLGIVYNYSKEFLIGFDYKRELWSDVRFFGEKNFQNRSKFSLGAQWLPDANGRKYFHRVAYRWGANVGSSYFEVNNQQLTSFSLTTGWGFPLKKGLNPTMMNVSFEYGHCGSVQSKLLREQFFKFTLNATINERWFMKRKLN